MDRKNLQRISAVPAPIPAPRRIYHVRWTDENARDLAMCGMPGVTNLDLLEPSFALAATVQVCAACDAYLRRAIVEIGAWRAAVDDLPF